MNPLAAPFAQIEQLVKELEANYRSKAASESNRAQVLYTVRAKIERLVKENKIDAVGAQEILDIIRPATCHGPDNKP
jgi:hypothetical protein